MALVAKALSRQTSARSRPLRLVPGSAALALGMLLLGLLLWPGTVWAADAAQRWTLADGQGQRWAVSLFQQPDPAYPEGQRLRVTALVTTPEPGQGPSHSAPLELRDAFGGSWSLANRSAELVPHDAGDLPAASAQFGLDGFSAVPRDGGPLRLEIPLAGGATATLVLGPAPTAALVEGMAPA
jgi:hypothetical protein